MATLLTESGAEVGMALTREEVIHVAELAKLKLTQTEIDLFQKQLSAVLDDVARLDELDTDKIPPTAAVLPLHNVMRPDERQASWPREQMLSNAPDQEDGFVKVKVVLEQGQ
jgi:aspartyl-tRNA(Asn)/glutamyl-tRNA(Gln) amidotransferase subunit C